MYQMLFQSSARYMPPLQSFRNLFSTRDLDHSGYDFWLNVVDNTDPNNYHGMVCSFITSSEYQLRFGCVVTHSNADCSQ